jgi:hypothetical protein
MSGVFHAIGKVFKKVVKVAKVVLPLALAAAAVVFTGGAALGVLPAFSTVVGGLVGSLGVGSVLAPILTGAITNAGFGSALGLVTGGVKGSQKGAIIGGLLGGVGGALAGGAGAASATAAPAGSVGNAPWMVGMPSNYSGAAFGAGGSVSLGNAAASAASSIAPAAATALSGGASPITSGLLSNPMVLSQAIQGIGSGVTASAQTKAQREAAAAEQARISANYQIGSGLMAGINDNAPPQTYTPPATGQWVYDARLGRLVRAQTATAA